MKNSRNDLIMLKGRRNFKRVFQKGKRFGSGFMQIRILDNFMELNRLGIVIPAKAVRKAVDRNRIRRLVKESFRTLPVELGQGYDIVVMVREKPKVDKMQFAQELIINTLKNTDLIQAI